MTGHHRIKTGIPARLPDRACVFAKLLASLFLYAVFGSSKQLVVAGTAASAVLVYSAITALHPKDAPTYAALAAGLIIATGLLLLAAGFSGSASLLDPRPGR